MNTRQQLDQIHDGLKVLCREDLAEAFAAHSTAICAGDTVPMLLGADHSATERVRKALHMADIATASADIPVYDVDLVVIVLNATQPLSQNERDLIDQTRPIARCFVVDGVAQLAEDELDDVRVWLNQTLSAEQTFYIDSQTALATGRADGGLTELATALKATTAPPAPLPAATAALRAYTQAKKVARLLRIERRQIRDAERHIADFGRALQDRLVTDLYSYVATFDYDAVNIPPLAQQDRMSLLDAARMALPFRREAKARRRVEPVVRSHIQAVMEQWQERATEIVREDLSRLEHTLHSDWSLSIAADGSATDLADDSHDADERAIALQISRAILMGGETWLMPTMRRMTFMTLLWAVPSLTVRLVSLVALIVSETKNLHEQEHRLNERLRELVRRSVRESIQESLSVAALRSATLLDGLSMAEVIAEQREPLSRFLYQQLSEQARQQLPHLSNDMLIDELNIICQRSLLYTEEVSLSEDMHATLAQVSESTPPDVIARMNRVLLSQAYPSFIGCSIQDSIYQAVAALTARMSARIAPPEGDTTSIDKIEAASTTLWEHAYTQAPDLEVYAAADNLWETR